MNKLEAITELRKLLRPGDLIYYLIRHVSKSGMTRYIDLYVVKKGEIRCISYSAAYAIERSLHRQNNSIIVRGCGMDMGFDTIYCLGRVLWPKGGRVNKSQRRLADSMSREPDGGYLLRYRQL